jgi:hypothetical protein
MFVASQANFPEVQAPRSAKIVPLVSALFACFVALYRLGVGSFNQQVNRQGQKNCSLCSPGFGAPQVGLVDSLYLLSTQFRYPERVYPLWCGNCVQPNWFERRCLFVALTPAVKAAAFVRHVSLASLPRPLACSFVKRVQLARPSSILASQLA